MKRKVDIAWGPRRWVGWSTSRKPGISYGMTYIVYECNLGGMLRRNPAVSKTPQAGGKLEVRKWKPGIGATVA